MSFQPRAANDRSSKSSGPSFLTLFTSGEADAPPGDHSVPAPEDALSARGWGSWKLMGKTYFTVMVQEDVNHSRLAVALARKVAARIK